MIHLLNKKYTKLTIINNNYKQLINIHHNNKLILIISIIPIRIINKINIYKGSNKNSLKNGKLLIKI